MKKRELWVGGLGRLGVMAVLCLVLLPVGMAGASITASRTSGVAPLGVSFSAGADTGGSSGRPFHDPVYAWDFGDPSAGVWAVSGKAKSHALGPVAAHVFESPGSYTVTLTISDGDGVSVTETVEVVVDDPDVVYGGGDTICMSDTAHNDFQGCPDGAVQIATDDVSEIKARVASGKRLLLHRGSSWYSTGTEADERGIGRGIQGPVTLGAYGAGENPDARGIYENAPVIHLDYPIAHGQPGYQGISFLAISQASDWRIRDISFKGNLNYNSLAGGATDIGPFLFLRVRGEGFRYLIATSTYRTAGHDQFMIVESDLSGSYGNVVYAGSEDLVLMGNDIRNAQISHVVRIWQAYNAVISHNVISGSSLASYSGRQALKLHGLEEGLLDTAWGTLERTRSVVVADNVFGSSGPWPVVVGPQNIVKDERLSDIIVENNRFLADYGDTGPRQVSHLLRVEAVDVSVRNNVLDGTGSGDGFVGIVVSRNGVVPPPSGVHVSHNTIYKTEVSTTPGAYTLYAGIQVEGVGDDVQVQNNLALFPDDSQASAVHMVRNMDGSAVGQAGNLLVQSGDSGLAGPDHADPLARDYALSDSSQAIDMGECPAYFMDFTGASRLETAPCDAGAFESGVTIPQEPGDGSGEPGGGGGTGTPQLDFEESYSGVAPFGVTFSAGVPASVPGSMPFHDLDYVWDFGDPNGNVWTVSRKSKNRAHGPVAAHVFDVPGDYVVTLTVSDGAGNTIDKYYEVNVSDPDAVFPGADTICMSDTGNSDFDGCPDGAVQVVTDSLADLKSAIDTGKRILLHRGSQWYSDGTDPGERNMGHSVEGPVTIGAYGTCENPDERGICGNAPQITLDYPIAQGGSGYQWPGLFSITRAKNWRIHDINFTANADYNSLAGGSADIEDFLFLRVKARGFRVMIALSSYQTVGHDRFMIVDCDLADASQTVLYTGSERLVLMGNDFRDTQVSHVIRVWQAYNSVISHNSFSGASLASTGGRHALKLHGLREELLDTQWGMRKRTRFLVLSDNVFGGSGPWTVTVGPQNVVRDERLSDLVIENNRFFADYGNLGPRTVSVPLSIHARYTSIRNNIIDGEGSGPGFKGIVVSHYGTEPAPTGVYVLNNTIHKPGVVNSTGTYTLYAGIEVQGVLDDINVLNNLVVFPEDAFANEIKAIRFRDDSVVTAFNNLLIQGGDPGFMAPALPNHLQRDFGLQVYSPAVDIGGAVPLYRDFAGNSRPSGAGYDIGAFEHQ